MENMEGLWTFFLLIIPTSILFILIMTKSADDAEAADDKAVPKK